MQPFDLLTEEDKSLIYEWCTSYGAEPQDIKLTLKEWNKSKKTLLKALGGNLRVEFPISVRMEEFFYYKKLEQVYKPFCVRKKGDLLSWVKNHNKTHEFIDALGLDIYNNENITGKDLSYISSYLSYTSIREGKILSSDYIFTGGVKESLKIPQGTKIMRAIRKVLEYYNLEESLKYFNKWRDDISLVNTDKNIDGTLVFSIHPIDYMTMSDNNSNWTSCMSWQGSGAYSAGTIEMMNSNLAIVAYLKNEDATFVFNGKEIPNKTWRTLVFAHKDLLLVGKNYPFNSKKVEEIILDKMQELLYNNLKWKYQYKKQKYFELSKYSGRNSYIRDCLERKHYYYNRHHQIFVYTDIAMYNDFIEDTCTEYICCRNYVNKSLYLNLCGKLTCLCCGDVIYDKHSDDFYYDDVHSNKKCCDKCLKKYKCACCGSFHLHDEHNLYKVDNVYPRIGYPENKICKSCLQSEYLYDRNRKLFVEKYHKDSILESTLRKVVILEDVRDLGKLSKYIHTNIGTLFHDCVDYDAMEKDGFEVKHCYIATENDNSLINLQYVSEPCKLGARIRFVLKEDYYKIKPLERLCLSGNSQGWFEDYDFRSILNQY